MDQLTLGIGTRLQHSHFGPGVIVAVKYATYLISFINHGIKIQKGCGSETFSDRPDT